MTEFVQWLLTTGRDVRLLVGDVNGSDDDVVRRIRAGIEQRLPDLADGRLTARPAVSLDDILAEMAGAGSVVALRFHNIVAALMLGKPVLAISYGHKQDSLMASFGVTDSARPRGPWITNSWRCSSPSSPSALRASARTCWRGQPTASASSRSSSPSRARRWSRPGD